MNTSSVISIQQLSKVYRRQPILKDVSLEIPQGAILGIVGNNGSGKTSLLKACMGLLRPSEGRITVLGRSPWRERHRICQEVGYIPDMAILDGWLKIKELLRFMQHIHPHWNQEKAEKLFWQSDLNLNQSISTLSKGMREKLYLLLVLAIDSKIMLLDEPTLGLDIPFRKIYIDQLLNDYCTDERTIVITTHQLEEFERIFDRVAFLDQGCLLLHEETHSLKSRFVVVLVDPGEAEQIPHEQKYLLGKVMTEERWLVSRDALPALADVPAVKMREPNLTDIFLGVIQGGLR